MCVETSSSLRIGLALKRSSIYVDQRRLAQVPIMMKRKEKVASKG